MEPPRTLCEDLTKGEKPDVTAMLMKDHRFANAFFESGYFDDFYPSHLDRRS
jgi:hypothetical protein